MWEPIVEMFRALFWYTFWKLLPFLLKTTRDVVDMLYNAVIEAEQHAEWSGEDKKKYVIDTTLDAIETFKGVPLWVLNTVVEFAHGYSNWKTGE